MRGYASMVSSFRVASPDVDPSSAADVAGRRRLLRWLAGGALLLPIGWYAWAWLRYPSDRTPEGAYLRVMSAVNRDQPQAFFAYLETEARDACYTLEGYSKKALERVQQAYPEPERSKLSARYKQIADLAEPKDVFALFARRLGWMERLRKDLSGIAKVDVQGERASVETVRGTRYPFRRRDNGIWGLTLFTAVLVAEAQKAARDFGLIDKAAADYERAAKANATPG